MKQTKMEKSVADTLDNFAPYCIIALSCIGLFMLGLLGLRYTPW